MATSSTIKFIEDALFCTNQFGLSYSDPDQKWIIRDHLISLLQDFSFLKPSVDIFTHNNGTEVKLLNANGEIRVSENKPLIPLTIWLHEFYPQVPPIVYVSPSSVHLISQNHPFVDSSGVISSSYLENWKFPRCSLSDLVRNLIKLFSHNHPLHYSSSSSSSSSSHPSLVSKMEAMDRLVCNLYYDMLAFRSKTDQEIEYFSALQAEMINRVDVADSTIIGLEHERENLIKGIKELGDESDKLLNWLKVYDKNWDNILDAFEVSDKKSEILLDCKAADYAIEDLIYALDKAVENGAISFEIYIKQVRILAREQFLHRARELKFT
ncbi:Ubiquitin-conjugating enzyme/RWD-like protein [Abeliophyllum distichum]|uniref:Ubiquitin-conjugating enzyme/RWD-like protein n=1 Tax=Abeliophyllum distichum TaxID=126358 RepID=A0ABD1TDE5_9LAMI